MRCCAVWQKTSKLFIGSSSMAPQLRLCPSGHAYKKMAHRWRAHAQPSVAHSNKGFHKELNYWHTRLQLGNWKEAVYRTAYFILQDRSTTMKRKIYTLSAKISLLTEMVTNFWALWVVLIQLLRLKSTEVKMNRSDKTHRVAPQCSG